MGREIVDAAYKVHTTLGPGLLESIYEVCLAYELGKKGLRCQRQVVLPIFYDDIRFDEGLRLDLVVEERVMIELKAMETVLPVHHAQALTYM